MNTNTISPDNPFNYTAQVLTLALKSAANKERLNEGASATSIAEIYNNSQEIFNKASHKERLELAKHLTALIDIKSTKLEDTIKQANATWITALKVFMVATVILSPIAAIIHYNQIKTTSAAKQELQEINNLKNKASELSEKIKENLEILAKIRVYKQEINDIVDVMNHKKNIADIKLGPQDTPENNVIEILGAFAINNKAFNQLAESSSKKNIKEVARTFNAPAIVQDGKEISPKKTVVLDQVITQFYKDLNRDFVISVSEKNQTSEEVQNLYTNETKKEAKEIWQKNHPNEKFQVHEFAQNVVTNLEHALGKDATRWSKPIQALCVQDSLADTGALKVSTQYNQWHDSNGVLHNLDIKYPRSFNVQITRSQADPNIIEKVTISLDTPIALTHVTKPKENNETVEELDHSLTYHLSMEVTLDTQNNPQIHVLRREFTKKGKA